MVLLSPECIYEILTFCHPKELLLCSQLNNNFNSLVYLDSLWKTQNGNVHRQLFNKQTYHETCKLYHQLNLLSKKFKKKYTLEKLYNLEIIYLDHNKFDINFNNNPILYRLIEMSIHLQDYADLELTDTGLQKIPSDLQLLSKLSNLHLMGIKLTNLPLKLELLTNLQCLTLAHNQLGKLSKKICMLPNLESLHLDTNKITKISRHINKITRLEYLSINHNLLEQLPVEIEQLQNLRCLVLKSNKLKTVSSGLAKLTNLKELHLENNPIVELPEAIKGRRGLLVFT